MGLATRLTQREMHPLHFCVPNSASLLVGKKWLLPEGTRTGLRIEDLTTQHLEKSCLSTQIVRSVHQGQICVPAVLHPRSVRKTMAVSSVLFPCRQAIAPLHLKNSFPAGQVTPGHQRTSQGPWAPQAAEGRLSLHRSPQPRESRPKPAHDFCRR